MGFRTNESSPLWKGAVYKFYRYQDGSVRELDSIPVEYRCVSERYAEDRIASKLDYSNPNIIYTVELRKEA